MRHNDNISAPAKSDVYTKDISHNYEGLLLFINILLSLKPYWLIFSGIKTLSVP